MLTAPDLARLEQVLQVVLAPQAYGCARTWGDALCTSLGALMPDAMVGLMRITPDGPYTHTPLPLADQVAYVRHYARLDPAAAAQAAGRIEIAHRWSLVPRETVRGTEFHEDWLRPRKLEDALWLNTFQGAAMRHRVFLSFETVLDTERRGRAETLLRLIAPAFRAGTASLDRHGSEAATLLRALDDLAHGAALFDTLGQTLHRTPVLERLLAADPERRRLELALATAARALGALALGRGGRAVGGGGAPVPEQRVRTAVATYTVRATLVPGDTPLTLVELVPAESAPAPMAAAAPRPAGASGASGAADERLRERFGLTPQEVAVARLMAGRRTDAEIGAVLGISPNTARTHAERVRRKLGVAKRTAVGLRLAEIDSAH